MDWLTIASLVISAGALVAYFATAETPKSRPQAERRIQGNHTWAPPAARQVDPEVLDRFVKALKSQSRPTA
jgi:hypothetical protein